MIRRVGSGKASLGVWRFSQCEAHTDQRRLCRNSILNCLGMLRRHVIVIGQHRRLVVGLGGLLAFTLCLWSALLRLVLGPCLILIVPALLFVLFGELRCLLIVSVLTIDLVWPGPRGAHNLASRRTFHADHCPSPPPDLLGSCLISAKMEWIIHCQYTTHVLLVLSTLTPLLLARSQDHSPSFSSSRSSGSVGFPLDDGMLT